jgi:D-alanyl-D-alanine endopeptidase (penicillin-binding protein 7)
MRRTTFLITAVACIPGLLLYAALARPGRQEAGRAAPSETVQAAADPSPAPVPSRHARHDAKPENLFLRSSVALVLDKEENAILYERKIDEQRPIASLTKLMTAIVCLDAELPLHETITIKRADRDRLRGSKSRLSYGTILTRRDALYIALAASENRAAHALARTYPGGEKAFVRAMNSKAAELGMDRTRFADPTGLHSGNVSTARDLVKLVDAAAGYRAVRSMTTRPRGSVTDLRRGWKVEFFNTNRLVRRKDWTIGLSKTGYIADAGNCLVMQTNISGRPLIIVLLNSWGKLSKFGDSNRIRKWLVDAEKTARQEPSRDRSATI